jgi:hypothetical protein
MKYTPRQPPSKMPASELSAFTHVFRADVATAIRKPRINKRARRPVSCVPCRSRKLKCDRQHPVCGGCQRRRDAASCKWDLPPGAVFAYPGTIGSTDDGGTPVRAPASNPGSKAEMQRRLQRLEEMISGLVGDGKAALGGSRQSLSSSGSPATTGTTASSPAQRSGFTAYNTGGHLSTSGTEMKFVGATHWAAVLESLHDIQGYLADADAEPGVDVEMGDEPARAPSSESLREEPDLLFGAMEPITINDVLAALPSRLKTDQMLGVYDQARFTQAPILHARQFRRQYEAFWLSPDTTSLLWISILFSTLATAVLSDIDVIGQDAAFAQKRFFTNKAMQCLLAGDYLKAKPFAVEALVSYTLTRIADSAEATSYLWSAIGLAARLAQRMGYHRDVAHITPAGGRPRVTPFQAEMRRRVWFAIEVFDVLFSLQLGMPTIIQPGQCDVALPRNLHDEDFDEDTVVLPPSRPETEPTQALYYRYKGRLLRQLRRIMLHALGVSVPAYEETLTLHAELEAIHAGIPPLLRFVRFRDAGPNMETKTILHNITLEIMYLKALCILHRPFLTRRKGDPACALSRRSCRQAALKILELHADMEVEVKLDGKLFEKGYLLRNLTTHDFLIAAMVLCLDLNESTDLAYVYSPSPTEQQTQLTYTQQTPRPRDGNLRPPNHLHQLVQTPSEIPRRGPRDEGARSYAQKGVQLDQTDQPSRHPTQKDIQPPASPRTRARTGAVTTAQTDVLT